MYTTQEFQQSAKSNLKNLLHQLCWTFSIAVEIMDDRELCAECSSRPH